MKYSFNPHLIMRLAVQISFIIKFYLYVTFRIIRTQSVRTDYAQTPMLDTEKGLFGVKQAKNKPKEMSEYKCVRDEHARHYSQCDHGCWHSDNQCTACETGAGSRTLVVCHRREAVERCPCRRSHCGTLAPPSMPGNAIIIIIIIKLYFRHIYGP